MPFINTSIDTSSLPAAEDIGLQPVHRDYKKILVMEWSFSSLFLVFVVAVLVFSIDALRETYGWIIITVFILLIIAFHFYSIQRSFPVLAYAVRDHDVVWRKGWIIRSTRICPFNRVQNCSVQSGPLERRFGLASLLVYTAGTEGADIRINGLTQEEADRLRYFILAKIHKEDEPA